MPVMKMTRKEDFKTAAEGEARTMSSMVKGRVIPGLNALISQGRAVPTECVVDLEAIMDNQETETTVDLKEGEEWTIPGRVGQVTRAVTDPTKGEDITSSRIGAVEDHRADGTAVPRVMVPTRAMEVTRVLAEQVINPNLETRVTRVLVGPSRTMDPRDMVLPGRDMARDMIRVDGVVLQTRVPEVHKGMTREDGAVLPTRVMADHADTRETRADMVVRADSKETRADGEALPTRVMEVPRAMEIPRDLDMKAVMASSKIAEVIWVMVTRAVVLLIAVITTRTVAAITETTAVCSGSIQKRIWMSNPELLLQGVGAVQVHLPRAASAAPVPALPTAQPARVKKAGVQNKFSFIRAGEWRSLPRFLKN